MTNVAIWMVIKPSHVMDWAAYSKLQLLKEQLHRSTASAYHKEGTHSIRGLMLQRRMDSLCARSD